MRTKILKLVVLLGWFFSIRMEMEVPGAWMTTKMGPFKTEALCKEHLEQAKAMMHEKGIDFEFKRCVNEVEV